MRVAMYLRVSTGEQTTDNQRQALEAAVAQRGWSMVQVYEDLGISGSKGRDKRPAFDKLHKDAVRGEFDMVVAWSVDRLGRSLTDLLGFLTELQGANVGLYLHQQAIDTSTPAGRMLFSMLGMVAEFERALIVERVRAGIARAKAQGKSFGRPRISATVAKRITSEVAAGESIDAVAKRYNVGLSTAYKLVRAA